MKIHGNTHKLCNFLKEILDPLEKQRLLILVKLVMELARDVKETEKEDYNNFRETRRHSIHRKLDDGTNWMINCVCVCIRG